MGMRSLRTVFWGLSIGSTGIYLVHRVYPQEPTKKLYFGVDPWECNTLNPPCLGQRHLLGSFSKVQGRFPPSPRLSVPPLPKPILLLSQPPDKPVLPREPRRISGKAVEHSSYSELACDSQQIPDTQLQSRQVLNLLRAKNFLPGALSGTTFKES